MMECLGKEAVGQQGFNGGEEIGQECYGIMNEIMFTKKPWAKALHERQSTIDLLETGETDF